MQLTLSTDLKILELLEEDGRNIPSRLASELGYTHAQLDTRLHHLSEYNLIKQIESVGNTGLYEITERGQVVLSYSDLYDSLSAIKFETLVDDALE